MKHQTLSAEQKDYIEFLCSHLVSTGEWPGFRKVEMRFRRNFDARIVGGEVARIFHAHPPAWDGNKPVQLNMNAIAHSDAGAPIVQAFLTALAIITERYFDGGEIPRISRQELISRGISERDAAVLQEIFWHESHILGSTGGGENWDAEISIDVRRYADVTNIWTYLERKNDSSYDAFWRETPAPTEGPASISYVPDTAFIMMWMDPARPELEDVLTAIRETCLEYGIKANRADEVEHQDRISEVILHSLRTAEFLIADLSGNRPNVYYEVGYAHAIGRRPILYRAKDSPLHFDLAMHNVPEYRNITHLRTLLRARLETLTNKKSKVSG